MTVNRIAAGAAACCAVLFVSGCGGGTSAPTGAASPTTTATPAGDGGNGAPGGRAFPGATGLLAQLDGTTLQVQGTDTQTAVTYSAKTTFTSTVAAKLSDVVVGVCVQARSARSVPGAGSAPPTTAPRTATDPIAAASVEISPAVNGSCTNLGGSRFGGARPPGTAGEPTPPSGAPTSRRSGGPGPGANGFGGFGGFGKVTAVNGASFTLESTRQQGSAATTAVPTAETVKTSATTTYTRTQKADAKALSVGSCVTALGKADDTGAIAATSIALRPAENGSCSSGFGRRGAGGSQTPPGGGAGA